MKKKTCLLRAIACLLCLLTASNVAWAVTIEVPTEGTLEKVIDDSDEPSFPTLKIVGRLNATDIAYLRTSASRLASIKVLDLSDVTLVSGDEAYATISWDPDDGLMSTATASFYIADENSVQSFQSGNMMGGSEYVYRYYSNCLAGAFAQMNYKQVVLPRGQKEIGECTFFNCENLTSVVMNGDVERIGERGFYGCSSLQDMDLSHVVEMGEAAFAACPLFRGNEEGIVNLSNLNRIPSCAFSPDASRMSIIDRGGANVAIKSIVLSSQLTEIGYKSFCFCKTLEDIQLPEGLLTIDDYAFFHCTSLESVAIPTTVTSIGLSAFSQCSSLSRVTIPPIVTGLSARVFEDTPFIKNLPADNGVVYLGTTALYYKGDRKDFDLVIREGTTAIGASFLYPSNESYAGYLKSVQLPSTLKRIGNSAFSGASQLTSITLPEGLEEIGSHAFSGCSGLTSVIIPNSVKSIGERAFKDCSSLTSIVLPESLESIGSYAFEKCPITGEVTIPRNVKELGDQIFEGNIWRINYQAENAVNIAKYSSSSRTRYSIFNSERIIIGANVRTLPNRLCYRNSLLKKVTFEERPDDVELVVGDSCFMNTKITEITLPNGTISIGDAVFCGCSGLTSIEIPNRVTSIEKYVFHGCSGLSSVTIPNGVTSIGEDAFHGCYGLTSVTIPNGVTSIGNSAFYDCSGLISITIPNSVTSIGSGAFSGCSKLTEVTIPNSVKSIGNSAFSSCSGLTSVTIPNSVTTIGKMFFYGCSSLTEVYIPNSVTTIGERAFGYCKSLKYIYCYAEIIPNAESDVFSYYVPVSTAILHVPEASIESYKTTAPWSLFRNIVALPAAESVIVNNTNFPDANFRSWVKSQSYGQDGVLTKEEVDSVTNIDVSFQRMGSLQGIEFFTALKKFECSGCQLTSIDISRNTALEKLYCYSNQLTAIDVSQNTALITLHCGINQLTSLDVSQNTALKNLHCDENQLTSLDLSNNVNLTELYCRLNQIKGAEMDALIESLPTGSFNTFAVMNSENEGNVVTTTQVAAAKAKGWRPIYWNGTMWQSYAGSEPKPTQKCTTPTINITEGKLHFSCETEGVTYVSHVEMPASFDSDSEDVILPKIKVSVYAKKEGYEDSDIAMKEIVIGSASGIRGDVNGDGQVSMPDAMFIVNRILNGKFPDE